MTTTNMMTTNNPTRMMTTKVRTAPMDWQMRTGKHQQPTTISQRQELREPHKEESRPVALYAV